MALNSQRACVSRRTTVLSLLGICLCATGLRAGEIQSVEVASPSPLNRQVSFYYRLPDAASPGKQTLPAGTGVLLLVPGFNGDGRMFLNQQAWIRFADREGLLLVSPAFQTNMEEIHSRKGYYYPDQWSGQATLAALDQIAAKTGVKADKIMLFGFSAGAHFTHRFALWKPDKVKAFVAYSAGWWDEPVPALRGVPALIMCGEDDERYEATMAFMRRGAELQLPWVWRSYKGTGHVITPQVVAMAQAFLAHYTRDEKPETFTGDMQSYQVFEEKSAEAERIPRDLRVTLPSKAVAEAWKQE